MNKTELIGWLDKQDACIAGMRWVSETEGDPEHLWDTCHNGSWMLWIAAAAEVDLTALGYILAERAVHIHTLGALRSAHMTVAKDVEALPQIVGQETLQEVQVVFDRIAKIEGKDDTVEGYARDTVASAFILLACLRDGVFVSPDCAVIAGIAASTAAFGGAGDQWKNVERAHEAAYKREGQILASIVRDNVLWAEVHKLNKEGGK